MSHIYKHIIIYFLIFPILLVMMPAIAQESIGPAMPEEDQELSDSNEEESSEGQAEESNIILPDTQQATPASNNKVQDVNVQVIRTPNFLRFIFESDEFVAFTPVINGPMLILDFNRPNNINLSNLTQNSQIVRSFGASPDGKSIIMRLSSSGIKLRRFISDGFSNGFDVFFDAELVEQTQKQKLIVSDMQPIEAGEEEIFDEEELDDIPKKFVSSQKIVTYPLDFVGPPRIEQIFIADPDFIGPPAYNFSEVTVFEIIKSYNNDFISSSYNVAENMMMMIFQFNNPENQPLAAVRYNDEILISFSEGKKIFLEDMPTNMYIDYVEIVESASHPTIRVKLRNREGRNLYSLLYRNKFAWIFEVTDNPEIASNYVIKPLSIKVEEAWGENKITLSGENISEPISITHPNTGQKINLFAVSNNSSGVVTRREFVDISVENSLQGYSIIEKSDFVEFKNLDSGNIVEVTKLPNLIISDEILTTDFSTSGDSGEVISKTLGIFPEQSIFPFKKAYAEEQKRKKELEQNASKEKDSEDDSEDGQVEDSDNANNEKEENQEESEQEGFDAFLQSGEDSEGGISDTVINYLKDMTTEDGLSSEKQFELAKYYFAKGMYPESQGMLYNIMILDPSFEDIFKVRSIYAATQFLNRKYDQALELFGKLSEESLNNASYNELKLWNWLSNYHYNKEIRNIDASGIKIDFISSYDKFMQQYPVDIRVSIALDYIDHLINSKRIDDAKNIIDMISYGSIPEKYSNDIKYYTARIAELEGSEDKAFAVYEELKKEVSDRKNRAKAIFRSAKYKLIHGQQTVDETIEEMMRSATVWRDDYFEMDVLETVGNLYLQQGEYLNALNSWKTLVMSFPQTTESVFVLGKMKELFIELFDKGIAFEMEPLQALKLYFKFRELVPAGEVGDRITRKVAQFFLTADMVEDAIEIIQHQINYRSEGDEQAKLILWLAEIYMENRNPESAYTILDNIQPENVTSKIIDLKKYAVGMALAKMGDYKKALNLIKNDWSYPANTVRLELFWLRENWFGLISITEDRFDKYEENLPNPLTTKHTQEIMRLAVAYAAQNSQDKMEALSNRFRERIENPSDIKLLDYLTSGSKKLNHKIFEDTVELDKIERFVNEYSFLPSNSWKNVIEVLEPKVDSYIGLTADDLSREQQNDIVKLGLAYALYFPEEERFRPDQLKKLATLSREFRNVRVNRYTIDSFSALDNKATPMINDAVFEGQIKLVDIPKFIEYYNKVRKISELNKSIRGGGFEQ